MLPLKMYLTYVILVAFGAGIEMLTDYRSQWFSKLLNIALFVLFVWSAIGLGIKVWSL